MAQLHELLAVENELAESANKRVRDSQEVLANRKSAFTGMTKEHVVFDEDSQYLKMATEVKEVEVTVPKVIEAVNNSLASYWDVILQKESANQKANADIIIDDKVIAANIPSIVLLGMEKKLANIVSMYKAIPVLDAAIAWEIDPAYAKPFVYRTKYTTERLQKTTTNVWKEVSKATAQHPAQVVKDEETSTIGKYVITTFAGALPSAEKSAKLNRLNKLIRAVKAARQRANNTTIDTSLSFGNALLGYINS